MYCCITVTSKLSGLEQHLLSHRVSESQVVLGRVSHEVSVKMSAGVTSSGLNGAGRSVSHMAHSHGCSLEASVPYHKDLSTALKSFLSVLMTWQLTFPRKRDTERESFRSHIPSFLPFSIGSQTTCDTIWKGTMQGQEYHEVGDHCRLF